MARERDKQDESSTTRLARSYLEVRAEQSREQQPHEAMTTLGGTVMLPRLDRLHLISPEAHAQYRLAMLARVAVAGQPWFVLAPTRDAGPRRGSGSGHR